MKNISVKVLIANWIGGGGDSGSGLVLIRTKSFSWMQSFWHNINNDYNNNTHNLLSVCVSFVTPSIFVKKNFCCFLMIIFSDICCLFVAFFIIFIAITPPPRS